MNIFTLWENNEFTISTPKNPHVPYSEGAHLIVSPKREVPNAWNDIELSKSAFGLASQSCKIMEDLGMSPWFNLQANGNWGLLPGAKPFFHIHVYGRNKTASWGKPMILPVAPGMYQNDPMPELDRSALVGAFNEALGVY